MATQESKSSLVAPILMATPTKNALSAFHNYRSIQKILTALEHFVAAFADDVETDHLLFRTGANELIGCGLFVVLIKHGERHGAELSTAVSSGTWTAKQPMENSQRFCRS